MVTPLLKPLRILEIGLSPKTCRTITKCLEASSLDVVMSQASDVACAIKLVSTSQEPFDFALLDSSLTLNKAWQKDLGKLQTAQSMPSILLAPEPSVEDAKAAFAAGITEYVEVDADGRYLIYLPHTVVRIVEHHRTREEKLCIERTLKRQARIVDQLGEAVIGADLDGNIVSWNQQAEKLFRLSAGDANGRPLADLLPKQNAAFIRDSFVEPLLIHGNHVLETQLMRFNGELFDAHLSLSQEKNDSGEVVGIIACCRDISVRMQAEKQLIKAKQQLEFHVQRTPLAYIEWNTNCRIMSWNPSAEGIFGYNVAEILDCSFEALVQPDFVEPCKEIFSQLIEKKGGFSSTNENITKGGNTIICEWYNTPLINEEGVVTGIASLVNDITERKHHEAELQSSKEAADAANRSKDAFLAVMSHEIRTPMNSIIGFADLLREQIDDPEHFETIEIIKANAYTLLELINNVLNYSRLDSGNVVLDARDTDIPLLMNEINEALGHEASQKDLEMSYMIEDKLPPIVRTDYLELRQILLNLVGNAIKFTSKGEIIISASAKPPTDDSTKWTYIFAVRDTGVGIPKDQLDKLFVTFSQVDSSTTRRFGGTGLGLAICRKICNLLGGEIWADSVPGKGTTFYFTLKGDVIDKPGQEDSRVPFEKVPSTAKILLVEDEPQTQQLLLEILSQIGHDCVAVSSGPEAIETIRDSDFDIVFMDVEMQGMNGRETTRRIRAGEAGDNKTNIFICALTAYTFGDDRQACLEAGMDEHLGKPILTKNLKATVNKAQQHKVTRKS